MSDAWYERVATEEPITQGDLIPDCPVLTWQSISSYDAARPEETLVAARSAVRADVVVMTQACDLEHDHVANIILCPHHGLTHHRELWEADCRARENNPTPKAWQKYCDQMRNGFTWNLTLLNRVPDGDLRVIDFHHVFTIPRDFVEAYLKATRPPRFRLLPPYREHVSQAFARFFMRVGLPTAVERIW